MWYFKMPDYQGFTVFVFTDDEVYMEGEEERKEYVLHESGKIWAGVHHNTFTWLWEFEQV